MRAEIAASTPGASLLEQAAEDVLERAPDDARRHIAPESMEAERLLVTVEWVERVLREEPLDGLREALCPPADHRILLGVLRSEILEAALRSEGGDRCDPMEALRALEAVEHAQKVLEPAAARPQTAFEDAPDPFRVLIEIAHDIRSPLTSVLFLAGAIRDGLSGPVNQVQKKQLGLVHGAAMGIIAMADDLMHFGTEKSRLGLEDPTSFHLTEVVSSVTDLVRPLAEAKDLSLVVDLPERDRVVGHPSSLGRVLRNLLSNAAHATEIGEVRIVVQARDGDVLRFVVEDEGGGIDPQLEEWLFNPLRRSRHGAGYSFSESGLGLTIVRKLLGQMGSNLRYTTERGRGTRFFFDLELPNARG